MRLFRRRPAAEGLQDPLGRLLAALDRIAATDAEYGAYARNVAADIRRSGPVAAEVHLARVAPAVAESFGATARYNPAIGALCQYGREALGVDAESRPSSDVRRRMAHDQLRDRLEKCQERAHLAQLRHRDESLLHQLRSR